MAEEIDPFAGPRDTFRNLLFGVSIATALMGLLGVPLLIGDPVRFYEGRYPERIMRTAGWLMMGFSVPGVLFTVLVRRWTKDPLALVKVLSEVTILANGFVALFGLFTVAVTFV